LITITRRKRDTNTAMIPAAENLLQADLVHLKVAGAIPKMIQNRAKLLTSLAIKRSTNKQ